jgi:hypothetical protein
MFSRWHRRQLAAALALAWMGACAVEPTQIEREDASSAAVADGDAGSAAVEDGADAPARGNTNAASASAGGVSSRDASTQGKPAQGAGGGASKDGGTAACETFSGSFEAIQKIIFERHGCTADACHGKGKVGGLDLRADVAWENLVDARSANSALTRVQPGTAKDSFLYLKLLAASEPGSVQVAGSPMPVGAAPLNTKELEAIQLWILKGAPKTGTVRDETKNIDVGSLLDACLPPAKPVKAKPLEAPALDDGVQLVLPQYLLKAGTEVEHCTPFAFDFTNQVPDAYKDVARNVMFVNGARVRQDPQSHHLVLWNPVKDLASVTPGDPDWKCHGGPSTGKPCDALKGSNDCGEGGVCAGKTTPGSLCGVETLAFGSGTTDDIVAGLLGLGPKPLTVEELWGFTSLFLGGSMPTQIANSQSPQQYVPPIDGVYSELPLKGILWFDSHAFNLSEDDTLLDARVNYYFARSRDRELKGITDYSHNSIANGQPPFTRKTYCAKHEVPQNAEIAMLTGHTHRRGEHFWVTDPAGAKIYESFDYNDPAYKRFEPWAKFESPDPAARTLEFCATFSNGLKPDGSADIDLVTRASRMPERAGKCTPVACVRGKVMAACQNDRECDSAPGANDGSCDACAIKAGQTTENEMFVLLPWYVMPKK